MDIQKFSKNLRDLFLFPGLNVREVNYSSILNCVEKVMLNCVRFLDIFSAIPFTWNTRKNCLENVSARKAQVFVFLFKTSIVYFLLTLFQAGLTWECTNFAINLFASYANLGYLICLCCATANFRYLPEICQLINAIHHQNKSDNFKFLVRFPKPMITSVKIYYLTMLTMLSSIMCIFLVFLIFVLPCTPIFVGNMLLPECGKNCPVGFEWNTDHSGLLKLVISGFYLTIWTMVLTNGVVQACLGIYYGLVFCLYIRVYCL